MPLPLPTSPTWWNILCSCWEGGKEGGTREGNRGWLELPTAQDKVYNTTTTQNLRQLKTACYLVYENRRRTCTATSTLTKIFVWPMECGVNYHKLIKGTERELMSFVLPALDTTAASQGHYFKGLFGLFLELGLVSQIFSPHIGFIYFTENQYYSVLSWHKQLNDLRDCSDLSKKHTLLLCLPTCPYTVHIYICEYKLQKMMPGYIRFWICCLSAKFLHTFIHRNVLWS